MAINSAKTKPLKDSSRVASFNQAGYTLGDPVAAYRSWEHELAIWRADRQFMDLPTGGQHIELAKRLTPKYLEKSADVLIRAGFARAEDRDILIERLKTLPEKRREDIADLAIAEGIIKPHQRLECLRVLKTIPIHSEAKEIARHLTVNKIVAANKESLLLEGIHKLPNEPRLQLDGAQFCWRIKGHDSVREKLSEASINQDPGKIGDYWAGTIIADGIGNVIRARQAIIDDPSKTSQKDYYQVPQDSGHRCFMSHMVVEDEDLIQTGEIQITESCQDKICKFTHKLKDIARSLSVASSDFSQIFRGDKTPTRMKHMSDELEIIRTYANDMINFRTGMNELAIPGHERTPEVTEMPLRHKMKGFLRMAEDYSGLTLKEIAGTTKAANANTSQRHRALH